MSKAVSKSDDKVPSLPRGRPTAAAREMMKNLAVEKAHHIAEFIGKSDVEPRDQIKAFDSLAKVGIGAAKDASVENVRANLSATLAVLREELEESTLERVIPRLQAIWA